MNLSSVLRNVVEYLYVFLGFEIEEELELVPVKLYR